MRVLQANVCAFTVGQTENGHWFSWATQCNDAWEKYHLARDWPTLLYCLILLHFPSLVSCLQWQNTLNYLEEPGWYICRDARLFLDVGISWFWRVFLCHRPGGCWGGGGSCPQMAISVNQSNWKCPGIATLMCWHYLGSHCTVHAWCPRKQPVTPPSPLAAWQLYKFATHSVNPNDTHVTYCAGFHFLFKKLPREFLLNLHSSKIFGPVQWRFFGGGSLFNLPFPTWL